MDFPSRQTAEIPAVVLNSAAMPVVNCNMEMELTELESEKDSCGCKLIYLDTVNSYLLLNERVGQIRMLNSSFETQPKLVCQYNRPVKVAYNCLFGSLVVVDSTHIGFRREHNWLYSLTTILDHPATKHLRLEMSFKEAKEWISFFSPAEGSKKNKLDKRPCLSKFAENLQKLEDEMAQQYSVVIQVEDGRQLLVELTETFSSCAHAEIQEDVYAILPNAFSLMERLRLQLFPKQPYSSVHTGMASQKVAQVKRSLLNSEAARRATFYKWPHNDYKFALPETMAEAGFFHQPNDLSNDRVLCFTCNVCLVAWEPNDDPYQEHERHSSDCSFINNPSQINIPLSVSMASLAAMPWSSTSTVQIQHSILGYSTSNCELFAFSVDQAHENR